MNYYYSIIDLLNNPDDTNWDYYHCHIKEDINQIFSEPTKFIAWTFQNAEKRRLILTDEQEDVQENKDININQLSQARSAHSISTFFLGYIIAKGLVGENEANFCCFEKTNSNFPRPFPFSYVWNLTSLYHDFGYCFENNKNLYHVLLEECRIRNNKVEQDERQSIFCFMEKQGVSFSNWDINKSTYEKDSIEKYIHDNINDFLCCNQHLKIPVRNKKIIQNYFFYRLCQPPKYKGIEHGIAGGLYFYHQIKENYRYYRDKCLIETNIRNFDKYDLYIENGNHRLLRMGIDQMVLFRYIADCIINHNIWKAQADTKQKYDDFHLETLIGKNYKKVNFHDNPLLFILCMADVLEPYKNLHNFTNSENFDEIHYDYNNVFSLFQKFDIIVSQNIITVTVANEWYEKYKEKINQMKDWIDIDYRLSSKESSYDIIIL